MKELIGKIISKIDVHKYNKSLTLFCKDGEIYRFEHFQSCCEHVAIEDICGDINDLIDSPILIAEEVSNEDNIQYNGSSESFTWTFYRLGTIKGTVTIRWLGESSGYYSENVDFFKVDPEKDRYGFYKGWN